MLWEYHFLSSLQSLRSPVLDRLMALLSHINDHGYLCIALAIVLIAFRCTRRVGVQVFLSIALAYILANLIVKNIVCRPRPYEVYSLVPLVSKPHDTSFPSGHSVSAFAAATAIFLNHKKWGIVALTLAAFIAFSRLYNQVHFPTDVLAGVVIGVGMAVLVHYVIYGALEKGVRRLKKQKRS